MSLQELVGLGDLFHCGQFVVCHVESGKQVADGEKKASSAQLSLDPRKVNREISAAHLKSGMVRTPSPEFLNLFLQCGVICFRRCLAS